MQTYEIQYQMGGIQKTFDVRAETPEEARRLSRLEHNPTLKIVAVERNPVALYLQSEEGLQFVELLRKFESSMYAKVRKPEEFFNRYEEITGDRISTDVSGIHISTQRSKWGDELLISFQLGDFRPNFPSNAKPRLYDGGRGILNDNAYVWTLIEKHGFRFRSYEEAPIDFSLSGR